jgi:hypothetical protein
LQPKKSSVKENGVLKASAIHQSGIELTFEKEHIHTTTLTITLRNWGHFTRSFSSSKLVLSVVIQQHGHPQVSEAA